MKKYLWLDTNIFEHFPKIEAVDWLTLASCEEVVLVIAMVTIRELNRHKDHSHKGKLRRRAANSLNDLTRYASLPIPAYVKPKVSLLFQSEDPLIEFSEHHLSWEVPDDQLIASAIEYAQEQNLQPDAACVVTADLGLQLKMRKNRHLTACPMPESLRLPDEPDQEEKEAKALEEEIRKLRRQLPDVSLTTSFAFPLMKDMASVGTGDEVVSDSEIAERMRIAKAENPYFCNNPAPLLGTELQTFHRKFFNVSIKHLMFISRSTSIT